MTQTPVPYNIWTFLFDLLFGLLFLVGSLLCFALSEPLGKLIDQFFEWLRQHPHLGWVGAILGAIVMLSIVFGMI